MKTTASFAEWLEIRDKALAEAIQQEGVWDAIRHPIKTLKSLKRPAMNLAMTVPMAIAAGRSAIPEIPEIPGHENRPAQTSTAPFGVSGMVPGHGEEGGEPGEEKEKEGIPGIDELAHYVAERLMKKLYELDAKMTSALKRVGKPFKLWLMEVAASIFGVRFPSLTKLGQWLAQAPQKALELVKGAWEAGHEVINRMNEPLPSEPSADMADVMSRRVNRSRPTYPGAYTPYFPDSNARQAPDRNQFRDERARLRQHLKRRM